MDNQEIFNITSVQQDKSKEIRYSRHKDFVDEVAAEYLKTRIKPEELFSSLQQRNNDLFLRPVFV